AYNATSFHLEPGDVFFFRNKAEAIEFAAGNFSDSDLYKVIYGNSESELVEAIMNGRSLVIGGDILVKNELIQNPIEADQSHLTGQDLRRQYIFNKQNKNPMNEKNFEDLKDQVKFTGFGGGLEHDLKDKMQQQSPKFIRLHEGSFGK